MAMVSRGYTGEARTLSPSRVGAMDVVWSVGCFAIAFLAIGGDRVLGR